MGNRKGRGISRVWGIGGVAAVGLAVLALSGFALTGGTLAGEAPTTAPITSTFQPEVVRPQVTTIGDSYTAGSAEDSGDLAEWPSLLTRELSVRVQNLSVGGVGYVQTNEKQQTLLTQSTQIASDSSAVVLMGSRNDELAAPAQVRAAASEAIANALKVVPAEKVLVVGPAWPNAAPPRGVLAARDAVRSAAEATGALFVDPLEERWLVDNPELIGADGVHPNDDGHLYLKDKMRPLIDSLIAAD